MKLVKFEDDTWGIRMFSVFGYRYFDFDGYWWERHSQWFKDCKTSEEEARRTFQNFKDKGKVVS